MSDAPVPPPDATTNPTPLGPPPIVVVKSDSGSTLFTYANAITGGMRMMAIVIMFMTGAMLLIRSLNGKPPDALMRIVLAVQIGVLSLISVPAIVKRRRHWRLDREAQARLSGENQDQSTMVRGVLLEIGGLSRVSLLSGRPVEKWSGRFQQRLAEVGLAPALTIVQAEIEEPLRTIPRDEAFVEPERVLGAMPRRSRAFWFQAALLVFFVWILVSSAMQAQWFATMMLSVAVVGIGMQLLKTFGIHLSQANAPIMGMGAYSDHHGRRWSVLDSTIYVYPFSAGFQTLIFVELIGPDGHHAMSFHGLDDPGLIMFWQRWMHPHPRPDLV